MIVRVPAQPWEWGPPSDDLPPLEASFFSVLGPVHGAGYSYQRSLSPFLAHDSQQTEWLFKRSFPSKRNCWNVGYILRKHMQWSVLQLNSTHCSSGHEHSSQMTPFLQLVLFYLIFTPSWLLIEDRKQKEHLCWNSKRQSELFICLIVILIKSASCILLIKILK